MKGLRFIDTIEDMTKEEAQEELKGRRATLQGFIKSYLSLIKKDKEIDEFFEPFLEIDGKTYTQVMVDDIKEDIRETKYIIGLLERKAY